MNNYTNYQLLFFKKLGIKPKIISSVEDINEIIKLCSVVFTFENFDIVTKTYNLILDKETMQQDLLINGQGGMCFKLNGVLYYFLKDCGLNVYITRGHELNPITHKEWSLDQTHIFNIVIINGVSYIVDIALGNFLTLQCIPITPNASIINSVTGLYKIENLQLNVRNFNYNWCFKFKRHKEYQGLKEIDKLWNICFVFNPFEIDSNLINQSEQFISDQLTQVQSLIINDKNKEFNSRLIATKLNNDKNSTFTLTENSLTITNCKTGIKNKTNFNQLDKTNQFNNMLKIHFNLKPILNKK